MCFAFSHFNTIFYSLSHTSPTKIFLDLTQSELSQPKAKPPVFQNIFSKFENQTRNSFYIMAKLREPISLQSKRPTFCCFRDFKLSDKKKT